MTSQLNNNQASPEEKRISALQRYGILNEPLDDSFDKLTRLAAKSLKVPVAAISIVDTDKIWFKSRFGIDVHEISREKGLCSKAILGDGLYIAGHEDIPEDLTGLKFYASMPLKTKEGFNLGALCIMDTVSRLLTDEEKDMLTDLRDIVMDQIELRLASKMASAQHHQILNTTAHDLKNPLTTIPVRADLIKLRKSDPEMVDKMCDQIKTASLNMVRIIDELLQAGTLEAGKIQLLLIKLSISSVVGSIVSMNQPLAERKQQTLNFTSETDAIISADEGKLSEIVDNLINNAIKYSPSNTKIAVKVRSDGDLIFIEVADQGQGLTDDDKARLYQRFTRLSAKPTGGENSTGLGLSIVKTLVEAHEGRIRAESDGPGKGSVFIVELPAKG